jgi:hypothetical protein
MSNGRQKFSLPAPRPAAERSRSRELFLAGSTYQEISEETNIPLSTLRNWCARDGWKLAKLQPDFELVIADDLPEAEEIPSELWDQQNFYQEKMSGAACRLAAHVATLQGEQIAAKADKLLKADQVARKALKLSEDKPFQIIQIGILAKSPAKQDQRRILGEGLPSLVRPQKPAVE